MNSLKFFRFQKECMNFQFYDPEKYRLLRIMSSERNRVVIDFAQVSDDKIAVIFSKRVCIYNLLDASVLLCKCLSEKEKIHSLHCIQDR